MLYLLDTSVVSLPTRSQASESSVARLTRIEPVSAISVITISELRYGLLRLPTSQRREMCRGFLEDLIASDIDLLPFDLAAAEWHAAERARLGSLGQTPPFADGQIAAIAATQGLTLLTLNLKDFQRFEGLKVEAW